jgi:hypothetical protein
MKTILGTVATYATKAKHLEMLSIDQIRSGSGHTVHTYTELISKLAEVAFSNPELVLLMRGQVRDYLEGGATTLFPTMYRSPKDGDRYYAIELRARYERLQRCEKSLYRVLRDTDFWDRVGRNNLARWAILQHYDVCPTPLLDVTHSPLVACSFARLGSDTSKGSHIYLYVLGVPQISGAVTVSPAQALQVVRLSSVCPPETLRPYFQEGYLMGTYPPVDTLDDKMRYKRSEMDCAQRLVAKFRIPKAAEFWNEGYSPLPETAVYPEERGDLCSKLAKLKEQK